MIHPKRLIFCDILWRYCFALEVILFTQHSKAIHILKFEQLHLPLALHVMLCYVEFIYRRYIQFPNYSTITSLEANQNQPKVKYYVNK